MAVRERDYAASDEAVRPAPWLARLNAFGERNAKVIIGISTALVILTVLLFAKYFYDQSMTERGEAELAQAEELDRLKEIKTKYAGYPVEAKVAYRLANKYNEEGKLEEARSEYKGFQAKFPHHPLAHRVSQSLAALERNILFETEQKERRLKELQLQTHPRQLGDVKDPRLQWGPVREPNPTAEIEIGGGVVGIELFEDEAPNAVASFIKLAEAKHFEGLKVEKAGEDRVQTAAKAADYTLAYEKTSREGEAGALVLVRKEGAEENQAGSFQILLKPLPDLKDATVFGVVTQNMPALQNLKPDDAVKSVKVTRKRDHPYEPQVIRKP